MCVPAPAQVKELVAAAGGAGGCLVLFSGDAFNPSLMSTVTLGKQMVREHSSLLCDRNRQQVHGYGGPQLCQPHDARQADGVLMCVVSRVCVR
jgi:hypothetical protein